MTQNIYALLVGIDTYKSHDIRNLNGCINDIKAIENYLLTYKISKTNLKIKQLTNQEATRQAIIDGFEKHLCQANSNDIALFYFSGHGSQEPVPQEFKDLQPNGFIETLVCWDSRTDNNWDLADKELALLINRAAQNNPQIVVILDCCHSGGACRDDDKDNLLQARSIVNAQARSIDNFYSPQAIKALFTKYNFERKNLLNFILSEDKSIFLSACKDDEESFERSDISRGVFSYFLTETLEQKKGNLSYQDLFNKIKDKVNNYSARQSPQFEVSDPLYADFLFLGDSVVKREHYYRVIYDANHGWMINAGGVHGIPSSYNEEKTLLAIFPDDLVNQRESNKKIAVAEVVQVSSNQSRINILEPREELDNNLNYKAIITSLPSPRFNLYLDGEEIGINLVRKILQKDRYQEEASLYIQEVLDPEIADLKLIASSNSYLISKPEPDNFILASVNNYSSASSAKVIEIIKHISRWHTILNLSSDSISLIPPDAIEITFSSENIEATSQSYLELEYQYKNGQWCPPKVQIELTNNSQLGLYCALLDLTEFYGVKALPFTGNSQVVYLEPGAKIRIFEGKAITVSIPEAFKQQNINKYKDILKLIFSTKKLDI